LLSFGTQYEGIVLRGKEQTKNAMMLARFLEGHKDIIRIFYPGLESFEGYVIEKA
jgi:cystathionine beta-lyase/cystathionine gamma-synthase